MYPWNVSQAAEALAAKVEEKAEELGMRVVTAVADEAGHPKLVRSMDGAYIGSLDVAVNKAYTCAAFQMSTAMLGELAGRVNLFTASSIRTAAGL